MEPKGSPATTKWPRPGWLWLGPAALLASIVLVTLVPEAMLPGQAPRTSTRKDQGQRPQAGSATNSHAKAEREQSAQAAVLRGKIALPRDVDAPPAINTGRVWILEAGSWPPVEAALAVDGTFEFVHLRAGSYRLDAQLGELRANPTLNIDLAARDQREVEVALTPGQSLAGRVVDALNNQPITGATVEVVESSPALQSFSATTDARGYFKLQGLINSDHTLSVRKEGYVPAADQVVAAGRQDLVIEIEAGVTLEGRVVDDRGEPVAEAQLEVRGETRSNIPFAVAGSGNWTPLPLFPGDDAPFDPALANLGTLGVTLGVVPPIPLQPSAAPVADANSSEGAAGTPFTTDAEGRFSIGNLPAGRVRVLARHASYAPAASGYLRLQPGSVHRGITITLPIAGVLEGRVLNARGEPVAGVQVTLDSDSFVIPMTGITNEQGDFRFSPVAGPCELKAEPQDGWPTTADVVVPAGETVSWNVQLLGGQESLEGRVEDERGQPLANASVELRSPKLRTLGPKASIALVTKSDQDGLFSFRGLVAGRYAIVAQREGFALSSSRAIRVPGAKALTISLAPGLRLLGEVRDAWTGDAIRGAHVRLDKTPHRAISNREGKFEIRDLSPGQYTLIATGQHSAPYRQDVAIEAQPFDRPTRVDVQLHREATISGTVVDRYGAPSANVQIIAEPTASESNQGFVAKRASGHTDSTGAFVLRGLSKGTYTITASHPKGGTAEYEPLVSVDDGKEQSGILLRLPESVPEVQTTAPAAGSNGDDPALGDGAEQAKQHEESRLFSTPQVTLQGSSAGVVVSSSAIQSVHVGDRIESINGESVLSAGQARSMLRGRRGSQVRVVARRGAKRLSLRLTRP